MDINRLRQLAGMLNESVEPEEGVRDVTNRIYEAMYDPFDREYEDIRRFLEESGETDLLQSLESMRDLYRSVCDEVADISAQLPDY